MHDDNQNPAATEALPQGGSRRVGKPGFKWYEVLTFRRKVALAFALVAALTTVLFAVMLTVSWNRQFSSYTRENMETIASSTSAQLASDYNTRGYWTTTSLQAAISLSDTFTSLGVQVLNASGTPIYDNTWLDDTKISLAPDSTSMVSEPILNSRGVQVGTVNVWAIGSDALLTQRDVLFRERMYEGVLIAALAAIIMAAILGLLFSRWLTKPLRRIARAADRIADGDLKARSGVKGSDDVGKLGKTFDNMAESIEKDHELERRLTADVAHELRTPLMAVMATVEAMQDGVMPCDSEHLALVDSEVRRLSRLVDSMLQLSRLESRSVRMTFVPTDMVDFVCGLVESRRQMIADVGLDLRFSNDTGFEEFDAEIDHDSMTQVVTNLLSNAMRYTPAPGTITIAVGGDADQATISVSDTGIGIAEDDVKRVFSRFWRAEESRNRAKGGLGIGLAVTQEIVDSHHGHIDVASQLGEGTTFTVVIPRTQPRDDD